MFFLVCVHKNRPVLKKLNFVDSDVMGREPTVMGLT